MQTRTMMHIKAMREREKRELMLDIKSDMYYTLEGLTGDKRWAKSLLIGFDRVFAEFGDSEDLYNHYMDRLKQHGMVRVIDGVTSFEEGY